MCVVCYNITQCSPAYLLVGWDNPLTRLWHRKKMWVPPTASTPQSFTQDVIHTLGYRWAQSEGLCKKGASFRVTKDHTAAGHLSISYGQSQSHWCCRLTAADRGCRRKMLMFNLSSWINLATQRCRHFATTLITLLINLVVRVPNPLREADIEIKAIDSPAWGVNFIFDELKVYRKTGELWTN